MTGDARLDALFGELPRQAEPPVGLEERVVAGLRARSLLGHPRRVPASWWLGSAAAMLLAFLAGWRAPEVMAPVAPPPATPAPEGAGRAFLLLLSPLPDELVGEPPAEVTAARVAEYAAWARELHAQGRLLDARKLNARDVRLTPDPGGRVEHVPRGAGPGGFFLIRAGDLHEALAIARTCPHLKHGGTVSVRPVDPT